MKYRMYIDEVGNSDLESSNNPNHRYLSLTGVIISLQYVQEVLHSEMEKLKSDYFNSHPDDPIVFHRKELVNQKYPFEQLQELQIRQSFDKDLLDKLLKWEYSVISVCLDKKKHKETYTTWRYDPYHYCLALLLERFIFYLEQNSATGDVMAESRGGKEDTRLKRAFLKLWTDGTEYVIPDRFQKSLTSKQLKVKSKHNNISGLQIADLLAHPSRNEILLEHSLLGKELAPFGRQIVNILQEKYYQRDGIIYGKKYI